MKFWIYLTAVITFFVGIFLSYGISKKEDAIDELKKYSGSQFDPSS